MLTLSLQKLSVIYDSFSIYLKDLNFYKAVCMKF